MAKFHLICWCGLLVYGRKKWIELDINYGIVLGSLTREPWALGSVNATSVHGKIWLLSTLGFKMRQKPIYFVGQSSDKATTWHESNGAGAKVAHWPRLLNV
jgi:hypothetical protein